MNQTIKTVKKERNHAVDLMKFFAAILITNSHMAILYPAKFSHLATGGAIGDSLFFFCSGYLLMLGGNLDFFNWYKRRVNRIFPTIFAVALIGVVFLGKNPSLGHVIIHGGGWFVEAIFCFYAVFWFVKRFLYSNLWLSFAIDAVVIFVWFIWFWDKDLFILYNDTYLRWPCYFMIMLMGAAISKFENQKKEEQKKHRTWIYMGLLVFLLVFYYGYQLMEDRLLFLKDFQIILLFALMGVVYVIYKLCTNENVLALYQSKYLYGAVYAISACCLEIYLSGGMSFWLGQKLIGLFPLNIVITFLLIFIIAYLVKVFSNFLSQTFKTEDYDWKKMVKLW